MSNIQVVSQTQRIEISPGTSRIIFNPATEVVTVIAAESSIGVINAGPPGPPGAPGSVDMGLVVDEINTRVATHNQTAPIHESATSGRDFVALFQNGLV